MTRPNAKRLLKFAGAASLVAMTAACASNDRRYYSDYQSGYGYNSSYNTVHDSYRDGYVNAGYGGGIDAAREAHRRYSEYEAERLDGNCERTVRIHRGETLSDIAEYCDVPVAEIIRDNPQIRNPRAVAAGERLQIPAVRGEVYEGSYRYAYRDALYRDASYRDDYNADRWLDKRDGRDIYVIRRGDTLAEIAWRFDVPLRTLYRLNPGVEPRRLEVGQAIYVPDYARTSPRERGSRDYVYYQDEPPLISITPARGPRDGKIRVIGDNFRQGEKVTVYFGDSRNSMTELKIVETDGDGRINEVVTLPDSYGQKEAYFAFRPSQGERDGYIMSEAYAIDGFSRPANVASSTGDYSHDGRYNGAKMRAMQDSIYWGDKITLRAEGFPPDTPVSIYGGPNPNSLEKLSEIRSGPRGGFSADVHAPESGRGGDVMFVAAIEDGPRTVFSERVRILDRDGRYGNGRYDSGYDGYLGDDRRGPYSDGYMGAKYENNDVPMSPQRLERGVDTKGVGWFGRFRGDRRDDYVGDRRPSPVGGVDSAGSSSIVGILTDEGQNCPALRDDSGNLYTLLGDLEGYDDGDRVLVRGSVRADDRICGQAETVQVYEIAQAPW